MEYKSMTIKKRPCPICFNKNNIGLYKQVFSGHFSHKIVKCMMCGFVFVENTPPQKYYDKYYKVESKYEGVRQHEAHEDSTYKLLKSFVLRYLNKDSEILDIGCSTGALLHNLFKNGYSNVQGIDPAPGCKKVAFEKYNIHVDINTIQNYKPKKKFNLIILSQVLEHLVHVRESIATMRLFLRDGGYVFIGVPDAGRFHKEFDEPFGEFSTEHINFFTEESLRFAMRGFRCIMMHSDGKALFSGWKLEDVNDPIYEYIKKSSLKQKKVEQIINGIQHKIVVWGVGALTRRLLLATNLKRKVLFFVDSVPNLIGKKIEGINIEDPIILKNIKNPILISSYKFHDEILKTIKKRKITNKIIKI